jgi:predicted MPP superfamily phosphohydrolase
MLGDWMLLKLLPALHLSYGPPKPTVLILAILRAGFALLPMPVGLFFQVVGTLLVMYGFWVEPHHIRITHQKLASSKLQAGNPFRVLHLSDLHIERITRRERQLLRLMRDLQPDIILFSGDVLNLSYIEDPKAWQEAREILKEWKAPAGVYAVTGSPAVDREHVFPGLVKGFPITWLKEDRIAITIRGQKIDLIGLTCTHKPFIDGPILEKATADSDGAFTILVYHTPDLAPNAANTGKIDLQLSGHTHGGQVRIPGYGAFVAASLYGKRFEAGRRLLGNMTLYVSRGIGLEGKAAPRVRFFCPPEIILWEIDGTKTTETSGDLH